MNKLILMSAVLALAAAIAGCETIKGVGRDITGAGSAVQEHLSGHGRSQ